MAVFLFLTVDATLIDEGWLIIICAAVTDVIWYSSMEEDTPVSHKKGLYLRFKSLNQSFGFNLLYLYVLLFYPQFYCSQYE